MLVLLHLAYMKSIMEEGEDIGEIITVDEGFKREVEIIKEA